MFKRGIIWLIIAAFYFLFMKTVIFDLFILIKDMLTHEDFMVSGPIA